MYTDDPEFVGKIVSVGTKAGKQIVLNLAQDAETREALSTLFKELFTSEPIIGAAR